ncbi:hypothetical protein UNSWDHB_794 [Dehalobacter sp. UNSWDHB]|nr:hypothetical protein UNSWDHB_794 [Dehalobacter sp. UNSWDHB]
MYSHDKKCKMFLSWCRFTVVQGALITLRRAEMFPHFSLP